MASAEDVIHKAVVQHLRHRGVPGLVYFHVPNDGKRSYATASRLKSLGMRRGVSDLILVHEGRVYGLELKAPGNRPTVEQLEFLSDLDNAGGFTCCVEGLPRAIGCLEGWGLVRGETQ